MPVESKPFFLPPSTHTETLNRVDSPIVTSENFSHFLRSAGPVPSLETGLVDHYNLRQYKPYLERFLRPSKVDYIHTLEKQQAALSGSPKIADPVIQEVFNAGREKRRAEVDKTDAIERGLTEYFDPLDGEEHATDLIDGVYGEVVLDVFELIKQGKDPGMAVHEHPKDSMFSFVDWTLFRYQRGDGTDARPVKASIVICPNVQIMALATKETPPVMDDQGMLGFLQHWKERFNTAGQEELGRLEEQQQDVVRTEMRRWRERMDRGFASIENLVVKKQARGLTPAEEQELSQAFARAASMNIENFDPDSIEEYSSVKRAYFDTMHAADNRVRMELAYEMNVGLYTSTNMEDFDKFPA